MAYRTVRAIRSLEDLEKAERTGARDLWLAVTRFRVRDAKAVLTILRRHDKNRLRWKVGPRTLEVLDSAVQLFLDLAALQLQIGLMLTNVEDRLSVSVLRLNQLLQVASNLTLRCRAVLHVEDAVSKTDAAEATEAALEALQIGRKANFLGEDQTTGPWRTLSVGGQISDTGWVLLGWISMH